MEHGYTARLRPAVHDVEVDDFAGGNADKLAWLERLESLYKQLAAHTIFPLEQIFFKNLAHGQWLLHRRLSALAQQQHNLLWEELGFAPFEKL